MVVGPSSSHPCLQLSRALFSMHSVLQQLLSSIYTNSQQSRTAALKPKNHKEIRRLSPDGIKRWAFV